MASTMARRRGRSRTTCRPSSTTRANGVAARRWSHCHCPRRPPRWLRRAIVPLWHDGDGGDSPHRRGDPLHRAGHRRRRLGAADADAQRAAGYGAATLHLLQRAEGARLDPRVGPRGRRLTRRRLPSRRARRRAGGRVLLRQRAAGSGGADRQPGVPLVHHAGVVAGVELVAFAANGQQFAAVAAPFFYFPRRPPPTLSSLRRGRAIGRTRSSSAPHFFGTSELGCRVGEITRQRRTRLPRCAARRRWCRVASSPTSGDAQRRRRLQPLTFTLLAPVPTATQAAFEPSGGEVIVTLTCRPTARTWRARRAAPSSQRVGRAPRRRRVLLVGFAFAVFLGTGATLGLHESLTLLPDRLRAKGSRRTRRRRPSPSSRPKPRSGRWRALDALVRRRVRRHRDRRLDARRPRPSVGAWDATAEGVDDDDDEALEKVARLQAYLRRQTTLDLRVPPISC